MTSTITPVEILFEDNFPGTSLRTSLWEPLAPGAEFKGQTYTFSNTRPYTEGGGFPTVSNGTARFALRTWDEAPGKPVDEHAFLGTEAITIQSWNPTTGGLSFEGRFKFSGDGSGNQAALNQGGMILGFFSYEKNAPSGDLHTEIDYEVFTSNLKDPTKNQISTNVFNGSKILKIYDPVHNAYVDIGYDPLSFPNNPLPTEYNTYRFEWFPNWINFYINGNLIRTVTNPDSLPDPGRDQRLHLNIWGQSTNIGHANGDWTGNPVGDPTLGPARTAADGRTYFADFQAVSVNRLSSRLGGNGADTLVGSTANDGIDGGAGDDILSGGDGDDTIMGGAGNDTIDGGAGNDTALFVGPRERYTITSTGSVVTVTDHAARDGVDSLTNVEFLGFSDQVFKLGDSASNIINGTAGRDSIEGLSGEDFLNGGAGDDTLIGGAGNDAIDGGTGSNTVSGGEGADDFNFKSGANALRDKLADLNQDQIADFGMDDSLEIEGISIDREDLSIVPTTDGIAVSVDGSRFEMTGDFSGGDLMTVARGVNQDESTLVTFAPFLPSLSEGRHVGSGSINGIANEPFLFGDGSTRFSLELKSAVSEFHNTLGVYTVGADGTIGDVRILFNNTLNVSSTSRIVDLGTPEDGARLAFFLIQDGSDIYGQLPDDLMFVAAGTSTSGNIARDNAITLHSATRGNLVSAPIFYSDATFNQPSEAVQVLSGVASGGTELLVGFEDVATASGDNDFQDVVIGIRTFNDEFLNA